MKALSIKQPWAYLIAAGIKDIENRTWQTKYRGKVLIHASAKLAGKLPYLLTAKQTLHIVHTVEEMPPDEYIHSAIIGEVDIVDCVIGHPSIWSEISEGDGKPIFNWVLANAVMYDKPILNVKGKLSFWDFNI